MTIYANENRDFLMSAKPSNDSEPPTHLKFDPHKWSRVEILIDAAKETARMAVAQPSDSNAVVGFSLFLSI